MKREDYQSRLFKSSAKRMKFYNQDWNPVGYASPGDAAPTTKMKETSEGVWTEVAVEVNDVWEPTYNGTIFGLTVNDYKNQVLLKGSTGYSVEPLVNETKSQVFIRNCSDIKVWSEMILALYLKSQTYDDLYYSPAIWSKTSTQVIVNIYSNTKPDGSGSWALVAGFTWAGDTSIDKVVRFKNANEDVIYINPSKFATGSFNFNYYNKSGLDKSVFYQNTAFMAYESDYNQSATVTPIEITGYYTNRSGVKTANAGYSISEEIEIDYNFIKSITWVGTMSLGAVANNVSFYKKNGKYISGYYGSLTTSTELEINVPSGAYKMILCNYTSDGFPTIKFNINEFCEYNDNLLREKLCKIEIGEWTSGYINGSGYAGGTIWRHSKFIPIKELTDYYLSVQCSTPSIALNLYTFYSDKDESTRIDGYDINGITVDINMQKVTSPEKARYVRFCVETEDQFNGIVFESGCSDVMQRLEEEANKLDENLFVVPKYIETVIGRNTDVFLDGLTTEPDSVIDFIQIYALNTNAGFVRTRKRLRSNPNSSAGNTTMTLRRRNENFGISYSSSIIFRANSNNNGDGVTVKNICISGDSLIDNEYAAKEMYDLLNEDADFIINQIGTRGTAAKHEGRGSWAWSTYVDPAYESTEYQGKTNAFMSGGVLDFQQYMADNFPALSGIDYFIMSLGTNDVTQGTSIPSDSEIATIISNAKIFIDALLDSLTGYPNCKIAIGLPAVGAPIFGYNESEMLFRQAIQKYNKGIIDEFDNGKYHANVTTVLHGAFIDRENSYPYTDEAINDYISETEKRYTNSVHPNSVGYQQWGRGYYNKIRGFLNGNL